MTTLNHNLSSGDKVLLTDQLSGRPASFQFTQTGITGSVSKIEVYFTTDKQNMPWVLYAEATLTIDPAKPSDIIVLNGSGYLFVQFKLVTGGTTVGVLNKIELQK